MTYIQLTLPPSTELPEDVSGTAGGLYVHLSSLLYPYPFPPSHYQINILKLCPFPPGLDISSACAPTADLPNTAALLGSLVVQEAIKIITKQNVPVQGTCVIDLIGCWTGILNP